MTPLEQERKRRGWSRQRLAAELARLMKETDTRYPISTAQIGRWERGESRPTDYWIEKLCALYEMTAEELGLYRAPDSDAPIARWMAPSRSPDPFVQTADAAEGAPAPTRVANDQTEAQTQVASPHRAGSGLHEHDRSRGRGMRSRPHIHRQW